MQYHSTRGLKENISAAEAIIRGLAPDGGLYVPAQFPSQKIHCVRPGSMIGIGLSTANPFAGSNIKRRYLLRRKEIITAPG